MNLKPVSSTNIKAVGHQGMSLFVQFHSGEVWEYTPCSEHAFNDLMRAKSIGQHFHKWIRSNAAYKAKLVESAPPPPSPSAAA